MLNFKYVIAVQWVGFLIAYFILIEDSTSNVRQLIRAILVRFNHKFNYLFYLF